jgi:hypothetical protein
MDLEPILVIGKISRLAGGMETTGAACQFRIGGMQCRASTTLAEQIVARRGYPGHEVRVTGQLQFEGPRKKVLAIETLELVD